MKKAIKLASLSLMLVTLLPMAVAIPPKPKPMMCPVCHMPLSMKMTKSDPVAMHFKPRGKVYYCCSQCKMPPKMLVKVKSKKMTKTKE